MKSLFQSAYECLKESDPATKVDAVGRVAGAWRLGELTLDPQPEIPADDEAGRPQKPQLVAPRLLHKRKLGTREGRAAMIHAIAHIEFNAINLALDAVCRFQQMPRGYYDDWMRVAEEEACHFSLVQQRLLDLGHAYGDFPAHNGLWELARQTARDPLVRMALVPRVMEARGLDVTPGIMEKFRAVKDDETVAVLEIILRDEIGHVEAGSRWFHYLCDQRGLEPEATYFGLLSRYLNNRISCPLHRQARLQAGFSPTELEVLERLCGN